MKIISAPFGNYIQRAGWVSTLGTFTPKYRGGLWWRLWRCMRTLRYDRRQRGWVNRLGLPNPGIDWLTGTPKRASLAAGKIISVGIASDDDEQSFSDMILKLTLLNPLYFELNASCPNEARGLTEERMINLLGMLPDVGSKMILKLPPDVGRAHDLACMGIENGITRFHCCNTLPTPRGGLSGPALIPIVVQVIDTLRMIEVPANLPRTEIIAGGGIDSPGIARLYRDHGADHIAVGSAWLNPGNWSRITGIESEA